MNSNFNHHFDRTSLEQTKRIMTHRGVIFQGLSYTSPLLNTIHQMNRSQDQIDIYFDRNNLSHMYVFEPHGPGFAAVPCNYFRYAKGLTYAEHRQVLAYCRRFNLNVDEEQMLKVLWEIRSGTPFSQSRTQHINRSRCPKKKQRRGERNNSYYISLMSTLGSEIKDFGKEQKHV